LERKWLIAIIIIAIVLVGGLGWYFFFGTPQQTPETGPQLYVDGAFYNTTSITWNVNASADASFYSLHNVTNLGNATVDVTFHYIASFYNNSTSLWQTIYNGTSWTIKNPNVTASIVFAEGSLSTLLIQAWQKPTEQSTYAVYVNYTEVGLDIKFQYLGNQPAVDGQTVFTYMGFDGNANGILDASDKAFNFTNNPNRANASMLQEYLPQVNSTTLWNTTAVATYPWSGATSPSDAPVSVSITSDRKNVTWAIPYSVIGANFDRTIGVVIQAFGYDLFPTGATTPNKYFKLNCFLPAPGTPFTFSVEPHTTVKFFFKVIFASTAIINTRYSFTFQASIPSSS
jgi:hypothetical protein